jgi:hypothetical protein
MDNENEIRKRAVEEGKRFMTYQGADFTPDLSDRDKDIIHTALGVAVTHALAQMGQGTQEVPEWSRRALGEIAKILSQIAAGVRTIDERLLTYGVAQRKLEGELLAHTKDTLNQMIQLQLAMAGRGESVIRHTRESKGVAPPPAPEETPLPEEESWPPPGCDTLDSKE